MPEVRVKKPYLMSQLGLTVPKLPFRTNAFEPVLSAMSVELHYGQHRSYCKNTQRLVDEAVENEWMAAGQARSLEDVVRWSRRHLDTPGPNDLFSQAAQAWNHAFMWLSMRPVAAAPVLLDDPEAWRERDISNLGFSSFGDLKSEFADIAADSFGSGWAWLVLRGNELEVKLTKNADTFVQEEHEAPLLVLDLWEHAFFLNFKFDRRSYVQAMVDMVLDWDAASDRIDAHFSNEPF